MDNPEQPVPAETPAASPAETPAMSPAPSSGVGSLGGPAGPSLIGSLVVGLMLIVPVRLAMTTTTYSGLYGWMIGGVVAAVLLGLILRALEVPSAIGLVLVTTGFFAVAAVLGLVVAAKTGVATDSDGTVALLVGVPAAAVAAPLAALALRWSREPALAGLAGSLVCFVGFTVAGAFGPEAFDMVDDARDGAEEIAEYESAGLTAYLPEIPEMEATYGGQRAVLVDGVRGVVGYDLTFVPEGTTSRDFDTSTVSVEVSREATPLCTPIPDYLECVDRGDYVVTVREGVGESVAVYHNVMRLSARPWTEEGELPDIDTIGAALADAEEVDWETIVALD